MPVPAVVAAVLVIVLDMGRLQIIRLAGQVVLVVNLLIMLHLL